MANVTLPAQGAGSSNPVIRTTTVSGAEIQHVELVNSSGTEIGTSGAPARVDPTGTTTQPISATSLPLPTGAATAAKQPALGTAGTASADVLTIQGIASMLPLFAKLVDEAGVAYGVKHISNKPRVSAMPYLYDIAEGNVSGHAAWEKIGYSAVSGTTTKDVWSYTDNTINLPTAATAMEVYTANAQDRASAIRGPLTADAGGTTTSLVDASEDFLAATAVAVGDLVILDKAGTTPEYGFVTAVATTTLTIAGGFSSGGTAASRGYHVVSVAAYTGAHAVKISYLTTAYAQKSEIVLLGGNATGVTLVNTDVYRVNSMRVISAGTGGTAAAAIQLWDADGSAPVYTYITAGYTRARNSIYTVPAGKTLYITQVSAGYATTANQVHNARIILRTQQNDGFKTNLFQAIAEIISVNAFNSIEFTVPIMVTAGVTLKWTAVPTASGSVVTVCRGWLE
jgi:hypothetical protein